MQAGRQPVSHRTVEDVAQGEEPRAPLHCAREGRNRSGEISTAIGTQRSTCKEKGAFNSLRRPLASIFRAFASSLFGFPL